MIHDQPTDYQFCIQCTDKISGKVGDFVYHDQAPFCAISEVFTDLVPLAKWVHDQGYRMGMISDFRLYKPFNFESQS